MPSLFLRSLPLVALVLVGGGCKPAAEVAVAGGSPSVNVRVAPVESSTATPVVRVAGVLALQTEADLAFPVPGLIESVGVRSGDRVKSGQELAHLQADQIEAQFTAATSALEKARRDLARVEKLQAERVATLENLQDSRTQVDQAAAALRSADFNRRHGVIVAPADGFVLRRLAEPNELVAAGRPVLSFASDADGWIAKASLAPRDAARISVDAPVTLDDGNGGTAQGKVIRIAGSAEPLTRTVPVEVRLEAPPPGARSGLIVSLVISPAPVPARSAVPLSALRDGKGGRAFLFVIDPATKIAKRVTVEVEQIDGERAYLRTALPAGQNVVVSGGQYLNDGTPVKLNN